MTALRTGQVLLLDGGASPQFAHRPLTLRLSAVLPFTTFDGWVWLSGYALDRRGVATARREVFVRWRGIRVADDGAWVTVTVQPKPPRPSSDTRPPSRRAPPSQTAAPTSGRSMNG
ncbi:hypothetical protein [Micromonospora sp. NPDC003241]